MLTNDFLRGLRAIGDQAGGPDIPQAAGQSNKTATEILKNLRKPAADQPSWLRELITKWVGQGPGLPPWADQDKIAAGQRFFDKWDLEICAALFTASLPSAYAGQSGVGVLAHVSQLAEPGTVARRISETGQMLLDITGQGALERPAGAGYQRIVRTRALHAAVREVVGADAPGGRADDAHGIPVNQEDLLATLMTFTVVVLRALERMGIGVTPAEREAYLHLWAVVGDLLGITEARQLLRGPRYADALTTDLQGSLQGPSRAGRRLMSILLSEMELAMPLGWLKLPRTLVRFLVGDRVAEEIGVPGAAWWSPALPLVAGLNRGLHRCPATRHIGALPSRMAGRWIIQLWIDQHEWGERPPFPVGDERARRWHLARGAGGVTALRRRLRKRRRNLRMRGAQDTRRAAAEGAGQPGGRS